MKDKDILKMLGLNDRTITLTADDEYLQIMLEKKIDNYFKKLDEVLNFSLTLGINPWQVKVFVLGRCSGCILGTPQVISY